jgi:hypothetical protein
MLEQSTPTSKTRRAKQLVRQDASAFTTSLFTEAILEITNTKRILNDKSSVPQGETT